MDGRCLLFEYNGKEKRLYSTGKNEIYIYTISFFFFLIFKSLKTRNNSHFSFGLAFNVRARYIFMSEGINDIDCQKTKRTNAFILLQEMAAALVEVQRSSTEPGLELWLSHSGQTDGGQRGEHEWPLQRS